MGESRCCGPIAKAKGSYARVSSDKQRDDLQRESKDIASGLHFSRKGFPSLLERIHGGGVEGVVVSTRDRLCRFAFELIECQGCCQTRGFGANVLRAAELLPDKLAYDSRLQRTKLGEYYLCIPMPLEIRHENQVPATTNDNHGMAGVISLDPGVRTFQTGYDPSGLVIECGKYDIGRIYRLCYVLDDLQSRWSQKGVKHLPSSR